MRSRKLMALCLSTCIVMGSLSACSGSSGEATTAAAEKTTAEGTASDGTTASADDETTKTDSTDKESADTTASDDTTASTDTTAETTESPYKLDTVDPMSVDYSKYVDASGWKNISLSKDDVTEDEATIQAAIISDLIDNYGFTPAEVADAEVAQGDVAVIDFTGRVDGEELEGGSGTDTELTIGSGQFIEGFESGLVGMKAGDSTTLKLQFPDPYSNNPDLAGKDVEFDVTVKSIKRLEVDKITDAEMKAACERVNTIVSTDADGNETSTIGEDAVIYDTLDAYLDAFKTSRADDYRESVIWQKVMSDGIERKEVCQELADDFVNTYLYSFSIYASYFGLSVEDYLSYYGFDSVDAFKEEIQPTAEEYAAQTCAVLAIADIEGIKPDKDEVDKQWSSLLEQYENDEDALKADGYIYGGIEFDNLLEQVQPYVYKTIAID